MSRQDPQHALKSLRRQLNIAGALVTAAVLAVGAWVYLGPMSRHAVAGRQRLENLQALAKEEVHIRADHAALRRQMDEAERQEALIQKRIPRGSQEADFLAQISQVAGDVGLQITDYRPGVASQGEAWSTLRVELTCEGAYKAICTLLDRLRELPRYSAVVRLEIGPGASPERHSIRLGLELYFLGDNRSIATK